MEVKKQCKTEFLVRGFVSGISIGARNTATSVKLIQRGFLQLVLL